MVPLSQPTAPDKFFHVIYEYRYLALAGRAWNNFGPSGNQAAQRAANELLPGIGVLLQDSLLTHARLLIDFYTKTNPGKTDIVLKDFGLPAVSPTLSKNLTRYKEPIEVHLLHLTVWRDADYRKQAMKVSHGMKRQRVDWNRHNGRIVDLLLRALKAYP